MTELQQLVNNCYEQKDMNMKIETLYKINSMLPKLLQLKSYYLVQVFLRHFNYRLDRMGFISKTITRKIVRHILINVIV
jgi:hypothetical protein